MRLEFGWRHARKRWSREFENSGESWILTVERWVFRISTDRDHWGGVSIVRIVSLSSCRHGPKSGINKCVRTWNNRIRLYCICICICIVLPFWLFSSHYTTLPLDSQAWFLLYLNKNREVSFLSVFNLYSSGHRVLVFIVVRRCSWSYLFFL